MRILIKHKGKLFRFMVVESSDRDGSLNVIFRREGSNSWGVSWTSKPEEQEPKRQDFGRDRPKNKRITVHQSGRVNYHENSKSIFIEPLTLTTQSTCIYRYRIPAIERLDKFKGSVDSGDAVFDLSALGEGAKSFSIFVCPPSVVFSGWAIKIAYEIEGYALAISVDGEVFLVPDGYENYFTTLSPERGLFVDQQIAEDQALISYHHALTGAKNGVLYEPNGEGFVKLIFAVPMRIPPAFKIELVDAELHVSDQDVRRENRSNKVMLKFRVRNRKTGQIIMRPVSIRSIELDARL